MKKSNQYAWVLGHLYQRTPKAVFAAIAVSLLILKGDDEGNELPLDGEVIAKTLLEEWGILHDNGIVPQKPPKL